MTITDFLISRGIAYESDVDARTLCSFRVGGTAALVILPKTAEELIAAADALRASGLPFRMLGKGSNVVFPDGRYDVPILSSRDLSEFSIRGTTITAAAGVPLFRLATAAADASLSGLEFAFGIPGSVGGAVTMNAGAYGGEISSVLTSCRCYDTRAGDVAVFSRDACDFAYRHSFLQEGRHLLLLDATFSLTAGERDAIRAAMADLSARRREKQPLDLPSAGSTFQRPEGHFAGKLIEDAGLKGFAVGGAAVSEKHAGFVVNRGGATAGDIRALTEHIRREVRSRFGVELVCEIEFL